MRVRHPLTLVILSLSVPVGLGPFVPAALAQSDGPVWHAAGDSPFEQLLAGLNSEHFQARQKASEQLRTMYALARLVPGGWMADVVESFLQETTQRTDLSPEQRARLLDVIREPFFAAPRAAMGIRFGPPTQSGMPVTPQPGFPCSDLGLLRPNDIITEIDGISVAGAAVDQAAAARVTSIIRDAIVSRTPGETIRVHILRAAPMPGAPAGNARLNPMTLDIPLGSWSDLRSGDLDPRVLENAWRYRMRRLGRGVGTEDGSTVLSGSLPADTWQEHAQPPEPALPDDGALRISSAPPGAMESAQALIAYYNQRRNAVPANIPNRGGQQIAQGQIVVRGQLNRPNQGRAAAALNRAQLIARQRQQTLAHLRSLNVQLSLLRNRVTQHDTMLLDPAIAPDQRKALAQELDVLKGQQQEFERRIDQVKTQLRALDAAGR